jgi:hypothetical protein
VTGAEAPRKDSRLKGIEVRIQPLGTGTEMGLHLNGTCEHCCASFDCDLISAGFSDVAYAYCGSCGKTALLDGYRMRRQFGIQMFRSIREVDEALLQPCKCGGTFKAGASPRCPACRLALSPERAATWMEAQAPGAKGGWTWQRNWTDVHCVIINGNSVMDNWIQGEDAS